MNRNVLSERDRDLLDYRFRITEPHKYPGLTPRLEEGARPVRILHYYDETPPGGRKAGHKPHVYCAFGHLHWHGFVVEIEDGRVALIGQHCAREHFGDEVIDDIEKTFNAAKDRQFEIRRLQAIRAALPAALVEFQNLARDPAITGFDAFWNKLQRENGKASRELAASVRSSQGRLIGYRKERDTDQEEKAAKKARPDLFQDVDYASTESERRSAVKQLKRFLDEQPRQFKVVPFDMGACDGWRLLNGATRPKLETLVAGAALKAKDADKGNAIAQIGLSGFAEIRNELKEAFENLDEALRCLKELATLTSPANVERISDWAIQNGHDIAVLQRVSPTDFSQPSAPALSALRSALQGEFSEQDLAA